jgi:hypothetical protein
MNFLINQNDEFTQSYSREEVQNLIDEKKIGLNTEIWTEHWGEWKVIKDTDFNLQNAIYIQNLNSSNEKNSNRKVAGQYFLKGIVFLALGTIVTGITYSMASGGGTYIVTTGLFVVGGINTIIGVIKYISN